MAKPTPPRRARRPLGVTILGGLVFLAGIVLLILAIVSLLALFGTIPFEVDPGVRDALLLSVLLGFALAIALLASGKGLLNLRPWAWWLAFLVSVLVVIRALFIFVSGLYEAVITSLLSAGLSLGLGLVLLGYIVSVKRHFR